MQPKWCKDECMRARAHTHTKYWSSKSAYTAVQETEKGEIYQSAQTEEPEPVAVSNTGVHHHQLFPEYKQHKHEPVEKGLQSNIIQSLW